jgi:hypothetical protein
MEPRQLLDRAESLLYRGPRFPSSASIPGELSRSSHPRHRDDHVIQMKGGLYIDRSSIVDLSISIDASMIDAQTAD